MSNLSNSEARLLEEIRKENLWQDVSTLSRWERISGTPDERAAVNHLRNRMEDYGVETNLIEFEALLPGHLQISLNNGKSHVAQAADSFRKLGIPPNLL